MPIRKLNEQQKEEFLKCEKDVVYFVKTYGWTKHTVKGAMRWDKPYPYQEDVWNQLSEGKSIVVNKTRQIGCSWACAAYSIWFALFHPDTEVLFLSETEKKAIRLLNNAKFFFDRLPAWLKPEVGANSQTRFSFLFHAEKGGFTRNSESSIDSLTMTKRSGASYSAALIIFDEAAHVDSAEEVFMAVKPATSHGGQIAIISTPGGRNNFFFRIWALSNKSVREGKPPDFYPIRAYWKDCGLTQEWYERATAGLTKQQIMQEFELAFLSSGSPFFDVLQLEECYYPDTENEKIINSEGMNIFRPTRMNFTGIDTSQGNRTKSGIPDYTSIVTLNEFGVEIESFHDNEIRVEEVAGYTMVLDDGSVVDVEGLAEKWLKKYRGAMSIEKFGPGDTVYIRQCQRVPDDGISYVVGRQTTSSSKQRMLNSLRIAFAGKQLIITDPFTYDCLLAFEDKGNGKYEAAEGFFDDPVIALALANAELSKHSGYVLDMPERESRTRMVARKITDDKSIDDIEKLLPVGHIVQGPVLEISPGNTVLDELEERYGDLRETGL